MILTALFKNLEESFSYKEIQTSESLGCVPMKTSFRPAENDHETPDT